MAARNQYWNQNTAQMPRWGRVRRYYRQRLTEIYRFLVPEGMRVLELGCGQGDLLAALRPSHGVGIDFSSAMITAAKSRYPDLHFIETNAECLKLDETFDYIVCSDLLNELWDVQTFFASLQPLCHPQTRFLFNLHSNLWQAPRRLASKMGIARPQMIQNWLAPEDITNLLYLADFEVIRTSSEVLWPVRTPFWDSFCNHVLVKIWPFRFFGLTNLVIARPKPKRPLPLPLVSVVVPARGEAGNIPAIFDRVPDMGRGTELIFVEGGSTDDTYGTIEREMNARKRPMTKLLRQTGKGKGDAVRLGFANATGELLMILDADLTVAPEDLPRFYEAWLTGKGDFINGVRMVYPMEERAMRFLNLVGNKFFSLAFSFLLGQKVKDTACGTKVLSKTHYEPIVKHRGYFGDFDRFGDWDLLFGAAKFNLKIVDLPIRYRDRVYGETKMQRWRIGILLLRMVLLGLRRLKFV
jgi:SAM-dependent methyltransferase